MLAEIKGGFLKTLTPFSIAPTDENELSNLSCQRTPLKWPLLSTQAKNRFLARAALAIRTADVTGHFSISIIVSRLP